jgi:hypothetical protein
MAAGGFRVTIHYREPSYEASAERPPTVYRWTYLVRAGGVGEAERVAIDEFKRTEQQSSVGWVRVVTGVVVAPA